MPCQEFCPMATARFELSRRIRLNCTNSRLLSQYFHGTFFFRNIFFLSTSSIHVSIAINGKKQQSVRRHEMHPLRLRIEALFRGWF